jgi:DNA-binding CsgD family transcriptional regulator
VRARVIEGAHGRSPAMPGDEARLTWYETGGEPQFTEREIEMLKLLAEGLTSIEVSEKMFLSIHTVRTHAKNLRHKTGRRTMAGAVALALRTGLIQ